MTAAAFLPGNVAAQTVVDGTPEIVGVADRQRPEFRPIGGRLGAFFLYPTLSVSGGATDNARADPARVDDAFLLVAGEARLSSIWSRHSLNLQAYGNRSIHSLETEDVTQFGGQLDGRLNLTSDTSLNAVVRADHLAEDRSNFASPRDAREPIRFDRVRASLGGTHAFGRFTLTSQLAYTSVSFEDAVSQAGTPISQRYRDARLYSSAASIAYAIAPGYSVLLSGAADRRDYSLSAADPRQPGNIERDSWGGRIETGMRLTVNNVIAGEIRAGYLTRNYADPRLLDTSGPSFGANLLWNVSRVMSVRAAADRRVDEAGSTLAAGTRVTEGSLKIEYEIERNLIVTGSARIANLKPLSLGSESSTERGATARALYIASRLISLHADFAHTQRNSPDPLFAHRENRVAAGIRFAF